MLTRKGNILERRGVGLSKINVITGTMWKLVHYRFIIAHRGHIDRTIGMMGIQYKSTQLFS